MAEHIPVITGAARTPTGRFLGNLASFTAPQLGAIAIKEAVQRSAVAPDSIDEVIMGNVLSAGLGQAPARQASLGAGLSKKAVHPMLDDLEMRRRRAAYRASHRGTKEMDIVLGRYAAARLGAMSVEELGAFERFLALPDPLLTQWFSQGAAAGDAGEFAELIAALRTHHGLTSAAPDQRLEMK